jgi:RNA polymerase sigma-32 factor
MHTARGPRPSFFFAQTLPSPLSAEEERDLALEYQRTQNPAVARRLVEANLRLVVRLARKHDRTNGRALPDLIQEGSLGLVEAVRRFQPDKGVRLSTYAVFWIRAFMLKFTLDNVRLVRQGRSRESRSAFFAGVVATSEISLEAPAAGLRGGTLGDTLVDPHAPADALLEAAEAAARSHAGMERVASQLDQRARAILEQRLLTDEPAPLREVAEEFSISGERVRQIEQKVILALRRELELAFAA